MASKPLYSFITMLLSFLVLHLSIVSSSIAHLALPPDNCGCTQTPPPPSPPPPKCAPPPPPPPKKCPPPPPPLNPKLEASRKVIQAFKKLIQLDPNNDPKNITSNWTGPDPCSYKGFNCSPNPSYRHQPTISDVQFNNFNLKAPLAGFLDNLPDVSIFHANSNRFHGPIPPIAASLIPFLFELDLSNNHFSGPFPSAALAATNLTFLDLRFNAFSGHVPPSLFSLDVDVLFINNNNFLQNLPSNLGSTPALYLTLANNHFTGPIPGSIARASGTLLEVLFLNNRLTGCLPWEIGLLKLARVFDVSRNELHGPIPSSFACLYNIRILNLASNRLDGVVPEALCELPKLTNLTLRENYFTEVGPKCRELISKKVLDVSKNCVRDLADQRPPEECAWFFSHEPWTRRCPDPYEHLPCKAAGYLHGGSIRRGAAEVGVGGPVLTYGALDPV